MARSRISFATGRKRSGRRGPRPNSRLKSCPKSELAPTSSPENVYARPPQSAGVSSVCSPGTPG
jgi:hypothetical protein